MTSESATNADAQPRVIVALDFPDAGPALALCARIDPRRCRVKVGKELFTSAGPDLVRRLVDEGFSVFLDLKFHDIPNTVAGACRAATRLGVWMLNVHALGGATMMRAARDAVCDASTSTPPRLIAVTVLTSMDDADLVSVGLSGDAEANVTRLAALTQAAGLDGVVCSPLEIARLRSECSPGFDLVTPGIRPASTARGDQKRTLTPAEALRLGASYLVIGRPVTAAPDPLQALADIETEIAGD